MKAQLSYLKNILWPQIIILCPILFLLVIEASFSQIPVRGIVAYYPFSGNANDESGNGNNGTVNGATLTVDRLGNVNRAYSFIGSTQYIDVQDSPTLNPQNALTISAWIKTTVSHTNAGIVGKWNQHGGGGQEQYVLVAGAGIGFYLSSSGANVVDNTNYHDGLWHCYAGTWDGTTMKLYMDGVLKSQNYFSGTVSRFAQKLEIGRYAAGQSGTENYFTGAIDEIRIYDRSLSSEEINILYSEASQNPFLGEKNGVRRQHIATMDKQTLLNSAAQLSGRIEIIIEQFKHEEISASNTITLLSDCKMSLEKEPSQTTIDKAESVFADAQRLWETIQTFQSQIKELNSKVDQLKREGINTSMLEKASEESRKAIEQSNVDLAQKLLSDAQSNSDKAWGAYQYIQSAESDIKQTKDLGGDISSASDRLNEAKDAINKAGYSTATDKAQEASSLAQKASLGKVSISELKALAAKYDNRTIVVSGKVRDIQTVYGRGYKFTIDDGSGLISVVYEGSLKDINDGDDVLIEGIFSKSQDTIIASKVDKHGFFSLTLSIVLGIVLIVGITGFLKFRKRQLAGTSQT